MAHKRCPKCKQRKTYTAFNKNVRQFDGYQSWCRKCQRARDVAYYANNEKRRRNLRRANLDRLKKKAAFVREYLRTHPCVDCGEADIVVLEFDHVNGKKTNNISTLTRRNVSLEHLQQEIAKCVVRCANCHRRVTAVRGRWHKLPSLS